MRAYTLLHNGKTLYQGDKLPELKDLLLQIGRGENADIPARSNLGLDIKEKTEKDLEPVGYQTGNPSRLLGWLSDLGPEEGAKDAWPEPVSVRGATDD